LAQVEPTEGTAGPQDAEIETHVEASDDADIQLDLQDAIQSVGPAGTTEVSITEDTDTFVLNEQPSTPRTPSWHARGQNDCIMILPKVPEFERRSAPGGEELPQTHCLCARELKPGSREQGCANRSSRSNSCPRKPTFRPPGVLLTTSRPGRPQVLTQALGVQREPLAKPAPPRGGRQRSCSAQTASSSSVARRGTRANRQALKTEQMSSACGGEEQHVATPGMAKSRNCRGSDARLY